MATIRLGEVTITSVVEIDRSSFSTASMLPDPESRRFGHDPERAAATRRAVIERHADSGARVLPAHFPRPGHIVRRDGDTRFEPAA